MTQFTAIFDATELVQADRFLVRLVNNLEIYFGSVKSLSRSQRNLIRDKRLQAAHMLTSSLVAPNVSVLFGGQVGLVKDDHLSADNITTPSNGKTVFDWSYVTKANGNFLGKSHDFMVVGAKINNDFLEEAHLASLSDVMLVLHEYVSQGSDFIIFTRAAMEFLEGTRIGVVVYSENHQSHPLDIYCQLCGFVFTADTEYLSFLGHLPNYKNKYNYNTLETIKLQNIAFLLLNLNYQSIPRSMLSEMSKGSLH